ncbi:MAG: sigma-70 family RNA polymerase sigma factor [Verrucomicrobia bacterium]|jgi:RNA polymerase sigma factor (sigma-70 family)|nr:sigma-70 family RNA polymerase sigma factor [Verrucomicrobiota bacterium]
MMTLKNRPAAGNNDAELVAACLDGNRDAFGQIVSRYQSLICSLAYSATGCLGQSEDLAQETFITAWKHLRHLREPGKLRAWLCGIARNRIGKALRRDGREPAHAAEPIEAVIETHAPEPLPPDHAISREEEAILWRSLERIPETYREPLVLFYREHQSVENVATALELSEDAVKQRLSRGRKLLHEEVLAFVEGALERTNPGQAFTVGVVAALPVFVTSASAATVGAAAVKGSLAAKASALLGISGAILGPVIGFLGAYLGYRMDLDGAQSAQRRQFIRRYYRVFITCIVGFFAAVLSLTFFGRRMLKLDPAIFVGLLGGLGVMYIILIMILTFWTRRSLRNIGQQEAAEKKPVPALVPVFEYRSKSRLLGWPLVHVRLRGGPDAGPVKAWIAAGDDAAIGLIFAFGGVAIAPISIGGFAIGLMPMGGFALGPVALGGFSLAVWSLGGFALGWEAFGGCAVAWKAAMGGAAVAHDFALGGIAQAAQANNAAAQAYIQASPFFQNARAILQHMIWLNLLWVVPLIAWWQIVARGRGQKTNRGQ